MWRGKYVNSNRITLAKLPANLPSGERNIGTVKAKWIFGAHSTVGTLVS